MNREQYLRETFPLSDGTTYIQSLDRHNMKKIYAKSYSDVLLIDHSRNVKNVATYIFNLLPDVIKSNQEWLKIIELSALLHDIGKCSSDFQKKLKNPNSKSTNKFRHNEIGWAFCYRYLSVSKEQLGLIIHNIYWHHGISNDMGKYSVDDILSTLPDIDIITMKDILIDLLDETYLLTEPRDENETIETKTPQFYYKPTELMGNSERLMINRIILIASDQLQSKFESRTITSIEDEINNIIKKKKIIDTSSCPQIYDIDRHNFNIDVAKNCSQTTIINGPGGMGKTDIGVHWNSLSDRQFMIVCPMNLVAQSVYNNAVSIKNNYNLDIDVQLFLTGEVVKSTLENQTAFNSNINVTNIDNFERPQIDDKSDNHVERMLMLLFADIQFDEYHELIMDSALFHLFVIIMKMRHNYTDSRTLLTSATPTPVNHLWDSIVCQTKILPETGKHYPAPHNKKFKLSVVDGIPNIEDIQQNNSLIIFNSIKESQQHKNKFNVDQLIHSGFQRSDIDKKLDYIYENYGKKSERSLNKPNLIGARMVQTSIDMSFTCLAESVCSPQDSLQRIPRINRWGDYENTICELKFFRANESRSECKVKEAVYDISLSDKWFEELLKYDGQFLTLDEMNVIYNNFNEIYVKEIKQLIRKRHTESSDALVKIYPVRFNDTKKKDRVIVAGSNKLRTSGNELMITAKIYGERKYCDPICQKIYNSIGKDFNEDPFIRNKIIKTYKDFEKTNDDRFDFRTILDNEKRITIDELRRHGIKSTTPYPRYDVSYHRDYGLIKNSDLEKLL